MSDDETILGDGLEEIRELLRIVSAKSDLQWIVTGWMLHDELKRLEWGAEVEAQEGGFVAGCPCCGAEKRTGRHYQDCQLSAALNMTEARR